MSLNKDDNTEILLLSYETDITEIQISLHKLLLTLIVQSTSFGRIAIL